MFISIQNENKSGWPIKTVISMVKCSGWKKIFRTFYKRLIITGFITECYNLSCGYIYSAVNMYKIVDF